MIKITKPTCPYCKNSIHIKQENATITTAFCPSDINIVTRNYICFNCGERFSTECTIEDFSEETKLIEEGK